MPVVVLEKIEKRFKMGASEVVALKGVDLVVEQGEMVAIMGPSGSGKSTLLHIIGCLDKPTSGRYWLEGRDVSRLGEERLAEVRNRYIGFVFQTFNLLPSLSALKNVELPLVYGRGERRRQRALESLERVGLSHRVHHRPAELSVGEQQRVAIARALINNPVLVLADEPTGSLDSATTYEIMSLFQRLNQEEGITIVIVTHNPEVADYAHRVVRLRDGLVIGEEVRRNETGG